MPRLALSFSAVVFLIIGLLAGAGIGSQLFPKVLTETVTETISTTVTYSPEVKTVTKTVTTTLTSFSEKTVFTTITKEGYFISVERVLIDDVSEIGYTYYIMSLEARYFGSGEWLFNWINLKLKSDTGHVYKPVSHIALREPMPAGNIREGEALRGQVAFKLPNGEMPRKIIYEDPILDIYFEVDEIPDPVGKVSYVYAAEMEVVPRIVFIGAVASIITPVPVYYPGETIEVRLEMSYEKGPESPETVEIRRVCIEQFELVEIFPSLPIELSSGDRVTVTLRTKAPADGYRGNLRIKIEVAPKEEVIQPPARPGVRIVNVEGKDKPSGYAIEYISGKCGEDFRLVSPIRAKYWKVTITVISSIEQPIHIYVVEAKGEYPYDWQHQNLPSQSGWKIASLTVFLDPSKTYEVWIRDAYAKPFVGVIEEHWWS